MLCISEFAKYFSLLFDTNVSKQSIYCIINVKMFNSLNKFQYSLLPRPSMNLTALFDNTLKHKENDVLLHCHYHLYPIIQPLLQQITNAYSKQGDDHGSTLSLRHI